MDNQHRQILGYRELTEREIKLINAIKTGGNALGGLIGDMEKAADLDQRWGAIAKTHLQEGVMALVRSVAKPESF